MAGWIWPVVYSLQTTGLDCSSLMELLIWLLPCYLSSLCPICLLFLFSISCQFRINWAVSIILLYLHCRFISYTSLFFTVYLWLIVFILTDLPWNNITAFHIQCKNFVTIYFHLNPSILYALLLIDFTSTFIKLSIHYYF